MCEPRFADTVPVSGTSRVKLYALSHHLASKIAIAAAYRRAARPSSPACIKADLAKWKKAIEDAKIPRIGG